MKKGLNYNIRKSLRQFQAFPPIYFVVADDWIDKLGERAFCAWLKMYSWSFRNEEDPSCDYIPLTLSTLQQHFNLNFIDLLTQIISPLWNYELIDLHETGEGIYITIYPYPQNRFELAVEPLQKVRDYEKECNVLSDRINQLPELVENWIERSYKKIQAREKRIGYIDIQIADIETMYAKTMKSISDFTFVNTLDAMLMYHKKEIKDFEESFRIIYRKYIHLNDKKKNEPIPTFILNWIHDEHTCAQIEHRFQRFRVRDFKLDKVVATYRTCYAIIKPNDFIKVLEILLYKDEAIKDFGDEFSGTYFKMKEIEHSETHKDETIQNIQETIKKGIQARQKNKLENNPAYKRKQVLLGNYKEHLSVNDIQLKEPTEEELQELAKRKVELLKKLEEE